MNKQLIEFLKTPSRNDTIIIFLAEELKPTSSLRKTFEGLNTGIAIACYKDDISQIARFISQYLNDKIIKYEPEVPLLLAENLPANQVLIINELEKLITYKADEKYISANDILVSVGDSSEIIYDDFCKSVASRESRAIQTNINRLIASDANFVLLLRVLIKFFLRIREIQEKAKSCSVERAVTSLIPPVFFKQKDNLVYAASKLSFAEVKKFLKILHKLETDCKSGKCEPNLLVYNLMTYWGKPS